MISTFDVLAEPTRRRILDLIRDDERPVNELVARLDISQPGVSKHLRGLRGGGVGRGPPRPPAAALPGAARAARGDRRVARAVPPPVGEPARRTRAPSRR